MKPSKTRSETRGRAQQHKQCVQETPSTHQGLRMEDARDTLVELSVEPEEKLKVKPMLNRPPLNKLGETLVIEKHFPVATHGNRTHGGTRRETRSEICA